jgi:F-type H+-transporting ATPase subunit delta
VRGASRQALAEARHRLDAELNGATDADVATAADELLSVSRLLSRESGLARSLADPGTAGTARVGLLSSLLEARLGAIAFTVLRTAVGLRWSTSRDLVDGIELLGAQAAFERAARSGSLDEVEDELFRFARIVERAAGLSTALADPGVEAERKRELVHSLLADKASPVTVQLTESVVTSLRGRTPSRALDELASEAALRRQREIAVVRVASPLDDDIKQRLAAALARTLGHEVRLQVEVDPEVVGGIVVQVGDEVFDGTMSRRLAQARRGLAP